MAPVILRRPLLVATALYIAVLVVLRGLSYLQTEPDPRLLRYRFFPSVQIEGRVASPLKEDWRGEKVVVEGLRIEGEAFAQKIMVFLPRGRPHGFLRPGQSILLEGRLRLPRAARNPGEFDERAFLSGAAIPWVLHAQSAAVSTAAVSWRYWPRAGAESVRRSIEESFKRLLSEEQARILSAITLGTKAPLRPELKRAIQDAGAMHLLVASGSNVALVMLAAAGFCLLFGFYPPARFLFAAVAGGFYTLMVGADAPSVRAYLAALAFFGLPLLDYECGVLSILALSALGMLLWEPQQLFTASFQMSFLAVLAIAVTMPKVNSALPPGSPPWGRKLAAILAVSVVVQIALWPIFAQVFGRGSLAGVLANVVLVPLSGLLMSAGFLLWSVCWLPWAALPAAKGVGLLVAFFIGVCEFFAGLPGAAVALAPMSSAEILAYYLLAAALLALPKKRAASGLALGAALLFSGAAAARALSAPELRVVMLSLPKARPALLTFKGNRHWLVDPGGQSGAVLRALRIYGVKRVERVILTQGRIFRQCAGEICFEFGAPQGPRAFKGDAEYSVIPLRLRLGALEAATDGPGLRIIPARGS